MGDIITPTVSVEVWSLDAPLDMFNCLLELRDKGYRGSVRVDEHDTWDMEVSQLDNRAVGLKTVMGVKLVMFGDRLQAMSQEEYSAKFG